MTTPYRLPSVTYPNPIQNYWSISTIFEMFSLNNAQVGESERKNEQEFLTSLFLNFFKSSNEFSKNQTFSEELWCLKKTFRYFHSNSYSLFASLLMQTFNTTMKTLTLTVCLKQQNPFLQTSVEPAKIEYDEFAKMGSALDVVHSLTTAFPRFLLQKNPKIRKLKLSDLSAKALLTSLGRLAPEQIPKTTNQNLTLVERIAIYAYTGSYYLSMNRLLFDGFKDEDDQELITTLQLIRYTTSGLRKLPTSKEQFLYRGASLTEQEFKAYEVDKIVQERRFLSTSPILNKPKRSMIHDYEQLSVLFVITNNRNGKDISKIGSNPYEHETLFPPGCLFKVIAIQRFQKHLNTTKGQSTGTQQQALVTIEEIEEVSIPRELVTNSLAKKSPFNLDKNLQNPTKPYQKLATLHEADTKLTHTFLIHCVPKTGTSEPIMIPIGYLPKTILRSSDPLSDIFKIINAATLNRPYPCAPNNFQSIDDAIIYRPNHNGTHSARQVGHQHVILKLIDSIGNAAAKKALSAMDGTFLLHFQLATYLMRAGRVDESSAKAQNADNWCLRSSQVYEAYAKQLEVPLDIMKWFSILLKNSGKPKNARCPKEIDANPSTLIVHQILYAVHKLDLIRINVVDEAFRSDLKEALTHFLDLEPKLMDELINKLLDFAENLLVVTGSEDPKLFATCSLNGDVCWKLVQAAAKSFCDHFKI